MALPINTLLTFDNVVFKSYVFWSAVLALKMLLMSLLTVKQRLKTRTFANAEDCLTRRDKVKLDDPDIERVRRAHLNDMENILPFFLIGFLYVLTNPGKVVAINLFRLIAISRIIHTFVYAVVVIPQPARGISFGLAFFSTIYMATQVLIHAF